MFSIKNLIITTVKYVVTIFNVDGGTIPAATNTRTIDGGTYPFTPNEITIDGGRS